MDKVKSNLQKAKRQSIMELATQFQAAIDLIATFHPGTVAYCVTPRQVELLNSMGVVVAYISHKKLVEYWDDINSAMVN